MLLLLQQRSSIQRQLMPCAQASLHRPAPACRCPQPAKVARLLAFLEEPKVMSDKDLAAQVGALLVPALHQAAAPWQQQQ